MSDQPPRRGREVLFEFQRIGNQVRVTAIDPVTGTEVTMIADARAGEASIKRLAARKLFYVMRKKQGGGQGGGPIPGGGEYA